MATQSVSATQSEAAPKKSELVAARIIEDIIGMGWPVGKNLGSEADLYTRYGVSRDIFREAVRRIERDGFAVMRRGVNGGLIVTAPAEDGVINALTNFLEIADIDIGEIIETQDILQRLIMRLATERLDESGIVALNRFRKGLDIEHSSIIQVNEWLLRLQEELARQTRNSSIVLFFEPLVFFTIDYFDLRKMPKALYREYNEKGSRILTEMVDAVVAHDISKAIYQLGELIKLMRQEVFSTASTSQKKFAKRGTHSAPLRHELRQKKENKAAEALALSISTYIQKKRLKPGDRLGSELELLERFDTCRSTFREAIRMLESVSRVKTKRGKGGGLSVDEPDPHSTIELIATYLQFIKFDLDQLLEVRLILECHAAEFAAKRASPAEKQELRQQLAAEAAATTTEFATITNALRRKFVACSHNRVLYLYCEVLNVLVLRQFSQGQSWKGWQKAKDSTYVDHQAIVQAIIDGDPALAHRRMYEHRIKIDNELYRQVQK